MENLVVGVLGCGKLGSLVVERLIALGVSPAHVRAVARPGNRARLAALGVTAVEAAEMGRVDLLVIAVKPSQFEDAWKSLSVEGAPLIVSCMAKTSLATVGRVTGSPRIIRLMTTTACVIGKGVGAWMPGERLDPHGHERARAITTGLGVHLTAERESEFALATALSSINGLLFLLVQYLEEAMVYIGAPTRYAALIVPLVESAMAYRRHRAGTHVTALADEVTSPAGTTAALRLVVHRAGVAAALIDAVAAAADRAKE